MTLDPQRRYRNKDTGQIALFVGVRSCGKSQVGRKEDEIEKTWEKIGKPKESRPCKIWIDDILITK
tara:strand:- start:55510 stop:55707 length:198 start_codon:yes stop_codon:yes gene_type:complete